MAWIETSNNRLQKIHPDGFIIIKPKDADPAIPLFCPVCNDAMKKANDAQCFRDHGRCFSCGIKLRPTI